MDLVHNLPKGLKSKFVNRAIKHAIIQCGSFGNVMHTYAKLGPHAAHDAYNTTLAARHSNQVKLDVGDEEE